MTVDQGVNPKLPLRSSRPDLVPGSTMTKIERYKWLSTNAPGDLEYIHKTLLIVDHAYQPYQRPFNPAKARRIAGDLNWAAFGVLLVARRRDGRLYVFDGQHRHAAAMLRSDIQKLPCAIFNLEGSIEDEATTFLVVQKERKALTEPNRSLQWSLRAIRSLWRSMF